jgi:hypothetical protein
MNGQRDLEFGWVDLLGDSLGEMVAHRRFSRHALSKERERTCHTW